MYNKKAISVKENHRNLVLYRCNRMIENHVKKYFNPLKPDSARVVYQILPDQYANPDLEPNPIKMEVEIRDKDSVLVFGLDTLTHDERKYQVLFWDGRDNEGQVVDPEDGPFEGHIALTYRVPGRQEEPEVVYGPIPPLSPIIIGFYEIDPSHRKFVPIKGKKITLKYRIRSAYLTNLTMDLSIFDRNGHPEIQTSEDYIYYTTLPHTTGGEYESQWNGKCTKSHSPNNEEGHFADPRENPYIVRLKVKHKNDVVFVLDEIYVVPEIVKVIGTHRPFIPDASCDESHPLELTNVCVLKGKIDNIGNETDDIIYYTEDGEKVQIWNGKNYHQKNEGYTAHETSYWIELLNRVEIDPELWNKNYLGNLEYTWTMTRGPDEIEPRGWRFDTTFTEPGTYVYTIRVRNYSENQDIQVRDSPEEQVKSRPSQIPTGAVENINDCYMIHLKATESDPYSWAQSFLRVPFIDEHPYPVDYHGIDCAGLIHAAEWLNGWEIYKRYAHQYVTQTEYSSGLGVINPSTDINALRNDWAGIDRKTANGGFDGTWNHIIMIKDYSWLDWHLPGNEEYEKTLGHVYVFINGYGGPQPPQEVREDDQNFFPIINEPDPTGRLWNIYFRRPNR